MQDIEPVVIDKHEFGHRDDSKLRFRGQPRFWCTEDNQLQFNSIVHEKWMLFDEIFIEKLQFDFLDKGAISYTEKNYATS